jgi:type II secretory pathway component PulM
MTTKPTITDLEAAAAKARGEYETARQQLSAAESKLRELREARYAGDAGATDAAVDAILAEVIRQTRALDTLSERWSAAERALDDAKAGRTT